MANPRRRNNSSNLTRRRRSMPERRRRMVVPISEPKCLEDFTLHGIEPKMLTEDLRTKVDFQRAMVSIKDGVVSYPWYWGITIQNGHLFASSKSFDTFEECLKDFNENGIKKFNKAQDIMKKLEIPGHE